MEPINSSTYPDGGKTTIAPEVLLRIVQLSALNVPGVSKMSTLPSGVNRLFNRGYGEGVQIDIQDDLVSVDLFLVLARDTNIRDVSRRVQREVERAVTEMVGMQVRRINIHVEDMDYGDAIDEPDADAGEGSKR